MFLDWFVLIIRLKGSYKCVDLHCHFSRSIGVYAVEDVDILCKTWGLVGCVLEIPPCQPFCFT